MSLNRGNCSIEEIEKELPNGFHDSRLISIHIDYINCSIYFEVDLYIAGDVVDNSDIPIFKRGRLVLSDALYCIIEPPSIGHHIKLDNDLWISDFGETNDKVKPGISLDDIKSDFFHITFILVIGIHLFFLLQNKHHLIGFKSYYQQQHESVAFFVPTLFIVSKMMPFCTD